eukprot:TRINITY_DN319_c0_g2_i1.p2 TRINITY_DN319_c0_g2~~TRINITY_DN319_c0_g2_i1.p2  ORF type:complete len:456 (+),score=133.08 TRINITY_DN319_c0_g2_i1:182-1369(+)
MYEHCNNAPKSDWFSFRDCLWRYTMTVMLHYWALLTSPIAYTIYTWKHNIIWYGTLPGIALSLFLPILPVGIALIVFYKFVESFFVPDWSMAGPGRVFFVKPKNPLGAFLWDCYLKQSMQVGQFYLVGTNHDAIEHTWFDKILTKDFWRAALNQVDGRLPRELGRWQNGQLTMHHDLETCDVVVKLPDSYLGIGDAFWSYGKDYHNVAELEKALQKEYQGKEALVLEMVRPKKELGVHSLDIVTLRTPDDDVKVLSCLLWTDCTTDSSHSCRAGYCVDVETETIVAPAAWYSPFFATMNAPLVGSKMPGVRKACATAVAAHKNIEQKWLTAVGWDAMVMEKEIVFFEGNFAGARTPRRMFLSLACLLEFVRSFAWPFGKGTSMRPGIQAFEKKRD